MHLYLAPAPSHISIRQSLISSLHERSPVVIFIRVVTFISTPAIPTSSSKKKITAPPTYKPSFFFSYSPPHDLTPNSSFSLPPILPLYPRSSNQYLRFSATHISNHHNLGSFLPYNQTPWAFFVFYASFSFLLDFWTILTPLFRCNPSHISVI